MTGSLAVTFVELGVRRASSSFWAYAAIVCEIGRLVVGLANYLTLVSCF